MGQGATIGADDKEGWVRPYQELRWETGIILKGLENLEYRGAIPSAWPPSPETRSGCGRMWAGRPMWLHSGVASRPEDNIMRQFRGSIGSAC